MSHGSSVARGCSTCGAGKTHPHLTPGNQVGRRRYSREGQASTVRRHNKRNAHLFAHPGVCNRPSKPRAKARFYETHHILQSKVMEHAVA
ncbi:hypothetical protein EGM97_23370 [Pseudomonas sp. AF32]|nr:hypothetical protein [Pseudomonas sp. AF32]